ncbi:hypothetical protein EON79_23110, partial [bacterium]
MFFTKYPHPANFTFGAEDVELGVENFSGGVARLRANGRWPEGRLGLVPLEMPKPAKKATVKATGSRFTISALEGEFGVMGEKSLWRISVPEGARFYGQGEKSLGDFELSGYRTRFWNTDVWSDFPASQWGAGPVDPPYFSTPYIAVRTPEGWVGFLLDNPYPAWMETPGKDESRVFVEWQRTSTQLILGN